MIEVVLGESITVKDLIRDGAPICVHEKSGTLFAAKWDIVSARVVNVIGKPMFTGVILPHDPNLINETVSLLKKEIQKILKSKKLKSEMGFAEDVTSVDVENSVLAMACPMFTIQWLLAVISKLAKPRPQLENTDGHDLCFCEARYAISSKDRQQVIDALNDSLCAEGEKADDDDKPMWSLYRNVQPSKLKRVGKKDAGERLTIFTTDDEGVECVVTIELEDNDVVIKTNSVERCEAARRTVEKVLQGFIGEVRMSMTTPEEMSERNSNDDEEEKLEESEIPEEFRRKMLQDFNDRHYRETLDSIVPTVSSKKTPRQMVSTEAGREKVIAWLKYIENGEHHRSKDSGEEPYDFAWMWNELGIGNLRG